MSRPRKLVITRKLSDASVAPDVAIRVGEREYHLHAIELRSRSIFFDRSLSDTWWRPENTHSGADGIKYRYKLVLDRKDPLMSVVEPISAKEDNSDDQPFPDVPGLANAYSNMFYAFCSKGSDSFVSMHDFEILVGLADLYCALPAIAGAVELALLKWLGCSDRWQTYTLELATLAYKLRVEALYHDVFVHLVGSIADKNHAFWKVGEGSKALKNLPQVVRLQVLEEYARISQLKSDIDRELVNYGFPVYWNPNDDQKFYANAMEILSPLAWHRTLPLQMKITELLKKNLKLGVQETKPKYLLCAKLEYYPWAVTDE